MRLKGLDSIRGIAAVVVVLFHALLIYSPMTKILENFAAASATAIFLNAQAAVIVFFVLSGFVLTYAIEKDGDWNLFRFLAKRLARLYIPYLCAVIGALGLIAAINAAHVQNAHLSFPTSIKNWVSIFAMIGLHGDETVDSPLWTICIEMQAAILMPLLARLPKWGVLAAAAALFLVGTALVYKYIPGNGNLLRNPWGFMPRVAATIYFFQFFAYGAAVFKFRQAIGDFMNKLPPVAFWGAGLASIACLELLATSINAQTQYTLDAIPACFIVALCACKPAVDKFLSAPIPGYLGKISFSLYLVHMPILLASLDFLGGKIGTILSMFIGVAISFPIAYYFNRFIEVPAANLSQRMSARMKPKPVSARSAA